MVKRLFLIGFFLTFSIFSQEKQEYQSLLKEREDVLKIEDPVLKKEKIKILAEKFFSLGEKSTKDTDIAVKCFEESANLYGWGLGEYKKQCELLEKLVERYPQKTSYSVWLKLVNLYWWLGWEKNEREEKLKKSIEICKKLLEKYPDKKGEILKEMVQVYNIMGNKEEAIKTMDEAISFYKEKKEQDRVIAELYFKKSDILFWADPVECIEPLQKIIHELNVDRDTKAMAYFKIGHKYSVSGDLELAIKNYENLINEYKDIKNKRILLDTYNGLGQTYINMGKTEKGIEKLLEGITFGEKENVQGIEWLYLKIAQVYKDEKKNIEEAKKYLYKIKSLKEIHPAVARETEKILSGIE